MDPRAPCACSRRFAWCSFYRDGAISLTSAGVERSFAVLDGVLVLLAYLAVQGGLLSPYR